MTTCARSGRCSRRRRDVSAHGLSARRDLPVRPLGARARDPGRSRPDAAGLGRRRVPGLLARRRRRADLHQADPGSAGRDPSLSVVAGRAAADAGLGSPGRHPRPRRPPERGVRRASAGSCASTGTSASRPTRRPRASSSACRTSSSATSSRAGCSPTSSTSSCSSTPGSMSARTPRTHKTLRCRPIDRLDRGARGDGAAAGARRRTPIGAGCCGSPPDPYLRFDTCDYSLDPTLVGRRVEVRVDRSRGPRDRAGHRRARLPAPAVVRQAPHDHRARARPRAQAPAAADATRAATVEIRSLARYDALIA